ncbi:hypothetical protein AVEN_242618-1 [Araneus ventricosus]|uniref:Uncharacterized protein n=1 Tax=Araneus ventricosus TaxID=182803 RepID=A0A4Y2KAM7_ARAVE|nr:hypothetical protein AVEN_242618-1 [Araneus ventricosus]
MAPRRKFQNKNPSGHWTDGLSREVIESIEERVESDQRWRNKRRNQNKFSSITSSENVQGEWTNVGQKSRKIPPSRKASDPSPIDIKTAHLTGNKTSADNKTQLNEIIKDSPEITFIKLQNHDALSPTTPKDAIPKGTTSRPSAHFQTHFSTEPYSKSTLNKELFGKLRQIINHRIGSQQSLPEVLRHEALQTLLHGTKHPSTRAIATRTIHQRTNSTSASSSSVTSFTVPNLSTYTSQNSIQKEVSFPSQLIIKNSTKPAVLLYPTTDSSQEIHSVLKESFSTLNLKIQNINPISKNGLAVSFHSEDDKLNFQQIIQNDVNISTKIQVKQPGLRIQA